MTQASRNMPLAGIGRAAASSAGSLLACFALTMGAAAGQAAPAEASSAQALVGAWAPQGARCRDGQFVTVYLPDGRMYSGMTTKGPSVAGRYEVSGNILVERVPYQTRFLTERRTLEKVTPSRIDLGFPGNHNPDLTTPPIARCPEQPGPEPWFPSERYGGFAPMRALLPKAR